MENIFKDETNDIKRINHVEFIHCTLLTNASKKQKLAQCQVMLESLRYSKEKTQRDLRR